MDVNIYQITGRTTRTGTDSGIHGLLVRVVDKKGEYKALLGNVVTHQDGRFTITYHRSEIPQLFEAKPEFFLQIFDRDNKFIYGPEQVHQFQPGQSLNTNIEVPATVLKNHFSRPLHFEMKGGRFLPRERLAPIQQALQLIARPETPEFTRLLGVSLCTLPPIDNFESLLDDAWGVLNGDLLAEKRFVDMLDLFETLHSQQGLDHTQSSNAFEPSFARLPQDTHLTASPLIPHKDAKGSNNSVKVDKLQQLAFQLSLGVKELAPVETLLGREALVPVVLAAGWIAGPDELRLDRYLRLVIGQIEAYRPFSILHTAAEMALSGGEHALSYFKIVFQTLDGWCGLGNSPFFPGPFPGIPELIIPPNPEELEHLGCSAEAVLTIREIQERFGSFPPRLPDPIESFVIDSISPASACTGDTITIRGSGFTSSPGLVRFTGGRWRGGAPVDVFATNWSDTGITVTVPEEASCGPLTLRIPEETLTATICDVFHDFSTYRTTTSSITFPGCRPRILSFRVDSGRTCVPRDASAVLSWSVDPDDAQILVRQEVGPVVQELFRGVGPNGSIMLDTSVMNQRRLFITAINPHVDCGVARRDIRLVVGAPAPTLTIIGVEVTQGIQRFTLEDSADPINNSVSLIAGMDTVIRVFVKSDRGGFTTDGSDVDFTRITGFLNFRQIGHLTPIRLQPINSNPGDPRGSNPFVDAKPFPSRRETNDSLNFLIPAGQANGEGILSIEVITAEPCEDFVSVRHVQEIHWIERPTLPVAIRRIADPDGSVVNEDMALEIVKQAFDRLPSPRAEIRLLPGVFEIHSGTAEANYCREGGMLQLAWSLAYEHNGVEGIGPADPHESVWIGLLFQTRCSPGGIMAWPWTSTCVSSGIADIIANPLVIPFIAAIAAHEIAHCVGMGHTRTSAGEVCNNLFQPVACHDLPNDGQLNDVVFDIRNNMAIPDAVDLMSNRNGFRFPHPNHWEGIRERMDTRF